jgi:hypothetical protein
MKNYSALIFLFVLSFVMASCDKDKDSEPTKQDLLMAKNWKVTAAKAKGTVNGSTIDLDYYNYLVDCQKDNFLKFNTNSIVIVDEGALKCTPTAPQTTQGNWSLTENATTGDILMVNGNILLSYGLVNNSARNLKILTLNNQTLKATFDESVTVPGFPVAVPATIELTFTAQ